MKHVLETFSQLMPLQDGVRSAMTPVFLLSALSVLFLYPAMILRKYVKIMINMFDDHAPWHENGGSRGEGAEGERVSFPAADGHHLEGVIIPGNPERPRMGMVVFAHEFGAIGSSCLRYCGPLLEAGYDLFTFDFRGHGASPAEPGYRPRQWPSDREQSDLEGALAFIGSWLERHGRRREVGLFGISRGAGAAILASVGVEDVRAIVTDGVFSSDSIFEFLIKRFASIFVRIRTDIENHPATIWRFLRWLLFRECYRRFRCRFPSVRKAALRLGGKPVLLIHGEKDTAVPYSQSQTLSGLLRGASYLWIVPGAKHNQAVAVAPDEYGRRVAGFFDEHLAARPEPEPIVAGVVHAPLAALLPSYVKK